MKARVKRRLASILISIISLSLVAFIISLFTDDYLLPTVIVGLALTIEIGSVILEKLDELTDK